jgi:hypothetical protein
VSSMSYALHTLVSYYSKESDRQGYREFAYSFAIRVRGSEHALTLDLTPAFCPVLQRRERRKRVESYCLPPS